MKEKLSFIKLITINTYSFGLSFLWNTLHPFVLPIILLKYVPAESKNTYLGLLTFFGLILAMLIQPLSGTLSDQLHCRWGKRTPFIALGTCLDIAVLILIAFSNSLLGIFVGYLALQITSNIAHGPTNALLADFVPDKQKGLASGIKNFMDVFGAVVAALVVGFILKTEDAEGIPTFFTLIIILCISALITLLSIHEKEDKKKTPRAQTEFSLKDVFHIDKERDAPFVNLLIGRLVFLLGINGVQTFAQYYIRDVLGGADPLKTTALFMIVITVSLGVCVLLSGWFSDRIGAEKIMKIAMLLTALGAFVLVFLRDVKLVLGVSALIGAGMGFYLTSNWAIAVKLAPHEQAGKFLGLTNLATAGASALGRLEGPIVDLFNKFKGVSFLGYRFLFFICFLCSLVSFVMFQNLENELSNKTYKM